MQIDLKIISRIFLIIFIYFLSIAFIGGVTSLPSEGDSVNYHIPNAKNIINGNFLDQKDVGLMQVGRWFPASSEIITAFFITSKTPLNLFNVLAIIVFAFVLYKLGQTFLKDNELSLIFALSVASLYGVFRLAHTQNIDIWVSIYFLSLIILLENPKKNLGYFLKLGFLSGMLIGSKYTGPFLFLILFVSYFKNVLQLINFKKIIVFLIPFSVLGLFWYVRNFLLTGSPIYPQSFLFFKGLPNWYSYLNNPMWKAIIYTPLDMINAYVSEFMIWPFLFLIIPLFLFFKKQKNKLKNYFKLKRILIICVLYFLVYLFLPYDNKYLGMVLSMRYTFSLWALIALSVFIISKYFKLEKVLSVILLATSFILFLPNYHPKLVFTYIPFVAIYLLASFYKDKLKIKFRR